MSNETNKPIADKVSVCIQLDGFIWFFLKGLARAKAASENRDLTAQDLIRDAIRKQFDLPVSLTAAHQKLSDEIWGERNETTLTSCSSETA